MVKIHRCDERKYKDDKCKNKKIGKKTLFV